MKVFREATFFAPHHYAAEVHGPNLPGRGIAEYLAEELRKGGLAPLGVFDEEPFWAVRMPWGSGVLDILVYIYLPHADPEQAIWSVSVPGESRGLLARFFGREAEPDPAKVALLEAIHRALSSDGRIRDVRWFEALPGEPYRSNRYAARPVVA